MKTRTKQSIMIMVAIVGIVALLPLFPSANLAATFKISTYAAKRVIDIISAAGSVYAVVGIVAAVVGGGGIGVGILASAKYLAKRYGAAYAAAW